RAVRKRGKGHGELDSEGWRASAEVAGARGSSRFRSDPTRLWNNSYRAKRQGRRRRGANALRGRGYLLGNHASAFQLKCFPGTVELTSARTDWRCGTEARRSTQEKLRSDA